jgi:hypothetical protein
MSAKRAPSVVRSLRAIARDPNNKVKDRLRACELLAQIDPAVRPNAGAECCNPNAVGTLPSLLSRIGTDDSGRVLLSR